MKNICLLAVTCVAAASCGEAVDGGVAASNPAVDKIFASVDSPDMPGCAVGAAQNGRLVFKNGYGMADLEHDIPITPKTVFRVGSVSKQFTATAILLLEQDGILSLDDDIRIHLPDLPEYPSTVSIRNLLNHSSGMPRYSELSFHQESAPSYFAPWAADDENYSVGLNPEYVSQDQFYDMIRGISELRAEPGTRWEYNNPAYFLLGQIVERASGRTLRDFAQTRIFGPLGMDDTFFNDRALAVVKNRAEGYHLLPDGTYMKFMTDLDWVGEGGVFTTIEDFVHWDSNYDDNQLGGGQAFIDRLTDPYEELDYPEDMREAGARYSHGLQIRERGGVKIVQHSGGWVAFNAHMMRAPELGLSTFVFCSTPQANASELATAVFDLFQENLN